MEQPPIIQDWQRDAVYLVQFPRARCCPSISPYCLKLETWLRMAEIAYHNVDNQFKYVSYKDQVPFVELNGRQIADTNFIITELSRIFGVEIDGHLDEREIADFRAYSSLIEDSLAWSCAYYRSHNISFLATEDGLINHFQGFRKFMFRTLGMAKLKRSYRQRCRAQGIGRNSVSEVEVITKNNLKALSVFLGNKPFMMGEQSCSLDATAFGHLCMFIYTPTNRDIQQYIETECRNLMDFVRNMKDLYWPDWNEATSKLSLATRPNRANTLSTVESMTRPKLLTPALTPVREPYPEAHDPRGDIEIFDVEEPTVHE
ncbi:hypothetical protein M3Y94_00246900 [Aphelenchoides besseyi]|nr:hypothetical protein M3Y94_00246900 [Aphelenchoides besseyi]KAI6236294.1 hypothetical protein M3Y95_00142200 [Aphelenchoides besseyi]